MIELSRRTLLVGGGLVLGAAAAAAAGPAPALARPAARTAARQFGAPDPFATLTGLPGGSVMQDFVYLPRTRTFFVTQAVNGSSGSRNPVESTVLSRVRASDGKTLDTMKLVNGGHGLGFEVEMQGDDAYVWMTWAGSSGGPGGEHDFVRFRYTPGTWSRGEAGGRLDLQKLPLQDRPEAVYHFDPTGKWVVERHFNWSASGGGASETFKRRRLAEVRRGVDRTYGAVTLPASPPFTQGFASVDDALFRWSGATVRDNSMDGGDPPRLQQYDWNSGRLDGARTYPTLSQNAPGRWRDGAFEPQGLCAFQEDGGTVSLLIGDVTGGVGNRAYHVSKVGGIG